MDKGWVRLGALDQVKHGKQGRALVGVLHHLHQPPVDRELRVERALDLDDSLILALGQEGPQCLTCFLRVGHIVRVRGQH